MPRNEDWLKGSRELQLAMANDWLLVLDPTKMSLWNIPQHELSEFMMERNNAQTLFDLIRTKDRTSTNIAECNAAFKLMTTRMRFFKNHYFLEPPLTDIDLISLGLKPHSGTHKEIAPPVDQVGGRIEIIGEHLLKLHMEPVANSTDDPHRSDYGFRIYWGILTPPGTPTEKLRPGKREITEIPVSGEDLPHSRFTRRKKELFDFPQEDRGKTVYFCIRYENAKGQPGPWGPMFSAIIP